MSLNRIIKEKVRLALFIISLDVFSAFHSFHFQSYYFDALFSFNIGKVLDSGNIHFNSRTCSQKFMSFFYLRADNRLSSMAVIVTTPVCANN